MKNLVLLLCCMVMGCSADLADTSNDSVPNDPFAIRPLMSGQMAPAFSATDSYGKKFDFNPGQMTRPALIIFYRGGWCPICSLYWSDLRTVQDQLAALDLDVIYLSADSPEVIAEAVKDETKTLAYHLLSDASSTISQAFGIAFRVDDETYSRYISHKIDLEAASGFDHHRLPAPAAFIVGVDGIIKFAYVNPDYSVRLHPDVLLEAARKMPDYKVRRKSD